jgi:hypothetical protein
VAGNIDKPRPEREGPRTFIGTGVDIAPPIEGDEDDLTEKIRAIVAEMLNSFTGGSTEMVDAAGASNITNIFNTYRVRAPATGWSLQIARLWEAINDLQSGEGSGSGVNVYKRISNNGTDGRYNCFLQAWVDGAWANVDENTVVVDYVTDPAGHAFNAEVFFFSIGSPDTSDIVPVDVLEMSIKKAYVKTTPGATTTLACYLDVDATGEEIDVACVIDGGGNLNACVPSVVDGDYIWVKRVGAAWVNVTPFMAAEACPA